MKKTTLFPLAATLILFANQSTLPAFSNSGYIIGDQLDISADCFENNGPMDGTNVNIYATILKGSGSIKGSYTYIQCEEYNLNSILTGTDECIIKAKIFDANGTIEGNRVTIVCDEFKFNGTITAQECIIYTKNSFDSNLFKRNPKGKYTIHITKNGFETSRNKNKISNAFQNLQKNFLHLSEKNIEDEIQDLVAYVNFNNIHDIILLSSLKRKIAKMAMYNKEKQSQNRGCNSDLYAAMSLGTLGAIGVTAVTAAIISPNLINQKLDIKNKKDLFKSASIVAGCSACSLLLSYLNLSEWLNPRYKEKYEKLSIIDFHLDQALMAAHIPEEEIILVQ